MLNKISEFEVQALAYWELKKVFPIVRGEYKVAMSQEELKKIPLDENGNRGRRVHARFDIVIFDSKEEMKLIIEVKKSAESNSFKQADRYMELTGVPCIYIRGMKEAEDAINIVDKYLANRKIVIE